MLLYESRLIVLLASKLDLHQIKLYENLWMWILFTSYAK